MVQKPGASAPTAKRGGSGYANAAGDAGDAASLTADTKHLESGHKQHRTQQHQYGASRVANKDSEDADEGELRLANDISTQLAERGFAVVRGIIAESSIARARAHLEGAVEKHLKAMVASGELPASACAPSRLPLEQRIAAVYAASPDRSPNSWVKQIRTSFVFHQLLFRDAALCKLVRALTGGLEAVVASRYNCRSKLPRAKASSFPWHQDHAYFRMQYIMKGEAPKRLLSAWAPLTHVDATNGGVEMLPASQSLGFRRHKRSEGFLTVAPDSVEPGVLAEGVEGEIPTLEPGDVLLFTDLTMHRSGVNTAPTARWSADWAYELADGDASAGCPPLGDHPMVAVPKPL